jgi:hypothetical protein
MRENGEGTYRRAVEVRSHGGHDGTRRGHGGAKPSRSRPSYRVQHRHGRVQGGAQTPGTPGSGEIIADPATLAHGRVGDKQMEPRETNRRGPP